MVAKIVLKLYRLLPLRVAYLVRRCLPRSLEQALRRRVAAPGGELEQRLRKSFERFQVANLETVSPADFRRHIEDRLGTVDAAAEGFDERSAERQRDLSIKFHWGHNHDFGDFYLEGRMGDRHLSVLANFCRLFPVSPELFDRKDVLDVGCWTGGTSLLLAALGSRVVALEEVKKYAAMTTFLARSFAVDDRLGVVDASLYACDRPDFHDRFDVAYFAGTLNNVSDPVVALRILYNACRLGGVILVESAGISHPESLCRFDGSYVFNRIPGESRKRLSRSGWSWFYPSPAALERMLLEAGFEEIQTEFFAGRLYGYGKKVSVVDVCRAGLSMPGIK